jgi:hypothetical protein
MQASALRRASCAEGIGTGCQGNNGGCLWMRCLRNPPLGGIRVWREPTSGLEPLTSSLKSWLIALLERTTAYQYVAYLSQTLCRGGIDRPAAYRLVPTRLQYVSSTLKELSSSRIFRGCAGGKIGQLLFVTDPRPVICSMSPWGMHHALCGNCGLKRLLLLASDV